MGGRGRGGGGVISKSLVRVVIREVVEINVLTSFETMPNGVDEVDDITPSTRQTNKLIMFLGPKLLCIE